MQLLPNYKPPHVVLKPGTVFAIQIDPCLWGYLVYRNSRLLFLEIMAEWIPGLYHSQPRKQYATFHIFPLLADQTHSLILLYYGPCRILPLDWFAKHPNAHVNRYFYAPSAIHYKHHLPKFSSQFLSTFQWRYLQFEYCVSDNSHLDLK